MLLNCHFLLTEVSGLDTHDRKSFERLVSIASAGSLGCVSGVAQVSSGYQTMVLVRRRCRWSKGVSVWLSAD